MVKMGRKWDENGRNGMNLVFKRLSGAFVPKIEHAMV